MFPNAQRMNRGGQVCLLLGILFMFDSLMHYELIKDGIWSLQLGRFIILVLELLSLIPCRNRTGYSSRLNYNLNICVCTFVSVSVRVYWNTKSKY